MGKQDTAPVLHCNIDEKAFSKAMFLCRFFTGLAMVYFALGSLFYWREFLVNTAALDFSDKFHYTICGICQSENAGVKE